MKLPGIAIKNFQFTLIIIFLLIMFGLVSFVQMPRSENPPVGKPGTSIIVIYPGATPKDMEQLVTAPIEEVLNELDDIKKIDSKSEDSLTLIQIEFLAGSDPDKKYSDVNEKVNLIREELPDGILDLKAIKWTIEDTNFLQLAIVSEKGEYRELESRADLLKKELEKANGVRRVKTWAFPKQEASISLDLEKIASLGIPVTRIIGIITGNNTNIPGGNVNLGTKKFNVETSGPFRSIDEIRNTIIKSDGKSILFLKDIASVEMGYAEQEHIARFDGKRSVFVTANQKLGTNIFSVMGSVKEKIETFKEDLPEGIAVHYIFDQSIGVDEKLSGFFLNLLQGIFLVGIVILLVLGSRGSLIVILVIPISIFIALGFVDMSGYGIEQMSIAGLVITLGLLVDNAIVVTENISRFIKKGYSRTEAAIKGSSEIGWPIISATLTTILAFVPIVMMQDVSGDFIRSMPVTVIYTLVASLFIALTFTPYLSSKFLRIEKKESRIYMALNSFIDGKYGKLLSRALNNPKKVLSIALVTFILSLALFPLVGVTFFPKADKYEFIIDVSTPEGTNIDTTDGFVKKIETILVKTKGVKHFTSNTGNSNPTIYYNMIEKQGKSNLAQIYVELNRISRKEMFSLLDRLREKFEPLAGVKVEVKEFEQGPPVEAPVEIKILGKKLEIINNIAGDVEKIFVETGGLININNPLGTTKTDIKIAIDRKRAGMSGVLLSDADRMIRLAVEGLKVSSFRDEEGKEFDIVFYGDRKTGKGQGIKIFDRIFVNSQSGAQIPLSQIASIELMASPTVVSRYNLERSVSITADVSRGYSVNKVTTSIEEKLKEYQWPPGYNFHIGGEKESQAESFGGMGKAVLVAVIAIFAVLVLQFSSFIQPLIIFAALPFAIIGSIIFLLITGFTFSFTAFVGLTSLVGIVINNSIILVDYTNRLISGGLKKVEALIKASKTRFTPIILTTFTTIGGLLPLTLSGGELWGPMGWTIIGGLLVSTVLTLIVVPVLYKVFTK